MRDEDNLKSYEDGITPLRSAGVEETINSVPVNKANWKQCNLEGHLLLEQSSTSDIPTNDDVSVPGSNMHPILLTETQSPFTLQRLKEAAEKKIAAYKAEGLL